MRLTREEKEIILTGLKSISSEYAYWGDTYPKECARRKLVQKFEKELEK